MTSAEIHDKLDKSDTVPAENLHELAERIAGLRDACGYTVEEFAQELGVDADVYRKYEETGFDVPASLLMHIAHVCKVDMGVLMTGLSTHLSDIQIVRAGKGRVVNRLPDYHFQDLAYNFSNKDMQPLLVTLDPAEEAAELVTHKGQEFNFVVEGRVELVFADQSYLLEAGDSAYFNPQIPHGQRCGSDEPATFVTVIND
jgi:quercetin dioxygenase-like cupin family protein/DNA-binding XRE family transcriptional regulator